MKKALLFLLILLLPFLYPTKIGAQAPKRTEEYIEEFKSDITINKDSSITVKETITMYFPEEKHGLYRIIPVVSMQGLKVTSLHPKVLSVTDEHGNTNYQAKIEGGNLEIKVGREDQYITGWKTYTLQYRVDNVLHRFSEHDELYWNITGESWPQEIIKATGIVTSAFGNITKFDCFAGALGTQEKSCKVSQESPERIVIESTAPLLHGSGLTVVVGLSKENGIVFPSGIGSIWNNVRDNWGYLLFPIPLVLVVYMWLKKGRDMRFTEETVYTTKGKERVTNFFERKYLPTVYSPIQGLTPAELGTLLDERVDMHDVVAEIVELARLGFLDIKQEKTEKKIFKDKLDFIFIKKEKDTKKLRKYQTYLLESLWKYADDSGQVKLSDLKEKFYKNINEFKKYVYEEMKAKQLFDGNPDTVRNTWLGITIGLAVLLTMPLILFIVNTTNPIPMLGLWVSTCVGLPFAYKMPRRTGKGYALSRQIAGLKYYLGKGKWRTEIYEKHLFLEEMLPISIALGVVDKLSREMAELGVKPPDYTSGFTTANFATSFNSFSQSSASVLGSSPNSSGGSGFGGGVGGGAGGGGGGSW